MPVVSIDFAAARSEREKLTIAVAGLISVNPHAANAEGVAVFAEEVRHWNKTRPDFFYRHVVPEMDHATALKWARDVLAAIPGWRDALFVNPTGEART